MTRRALPMPPCERVRDMAKGRGRAASIRRLYALRCSPIEIATFLHVGTDEVRRTVQRPAGRSRRA